MKKRIIVVSIMIVCVISLVANFIFLLPYIEKEENILENNKIDRDKTYAIMVQNEDKTGYIESTSNTFPSDMTLNLELTNCVDESGNSVTNPFTYENGIITVRTSKKIYCYLYFDILNEPLGSYLISDPTAGLNTTLEGGLYRYQGANGTVDNYVCFGTSDKSTCIGNTDAYLYRIIGITEDGRIKLLKNEALNSTIKWHSSRTTNTTWPISTLYSNINGSLFLSNPLYMSSDWENKIETTTWKYGDLSTVNTTANALYDIENSWINTVAAKIGLIYVHDYAYAYQSGGLNCSGSGAYSKCKTSWIQLALCDTSAPSGWEWTMSRYGLVSSSNVYSAYDVSSGGIVNGNALDLDYSVRPVFFLKNDIKLIGGIGTSDDPFIIS